MAKRKKGIAKEFKKISEERAKEKFDLCETDLAQEMSKFFYIPLDKLCPNREYTFLRMARESIKIIGNYYEIIPTFWQD